MQVKLPPSFPLPEVRSPGVVSVRSRDLHVLVREIVVAMSAQSKTWRHDDPAEALADVQLILRFARAMAEATIAAEWGDS